MRAETRWESGGEAVREAMGDKTKQGKLRGIARPSSPSQLHHVASLVYLTGRLLSTPCLCSLPNRLQTTSRTRI